MKMLASCLLAAGVLALKSNAQNYKTALNNLSLEEVEAIMAASPYARLSDDIYHASPNTQSIPTGWKAIPNSDDRAKIPAFVVPGTKTIPGTVANSTPAVRGTERNVPEIPDPIGFHARAYKNEKANTVAIVFEGTGSFIDWEENFKHTRTIPAQYHRAVEYAAKVIKENSGSKVVFTGHSLGGGLATYAYYKTVTEPASAKLTTFNAAGLFTRTYEDANVANKTELTSNAKSFITTAYFASGTPAQEFVSSIDSKFGAKHINPRYLPINGEVERPPGFTSNLSSPGGASVRRGRVALHSMSYAIAAIDAVAAASPSLSQRLTVSTFPNQPQGPIATKLGQQETTNKLTDDEKRSIAKGLGLAAPPKTNASKPESTAPPSSVSVPAGQVSNTAFRPLSSASQPAVETAGTSPKAGNSPPKATGATPSNAAPPAHEARKGEIATTPTPAKASVSVIAGKPAGKETPTSSALARPTESKGTTTQTPTQTAAPSVVVKPVPSTIPFHLAFPVTADKASGKELPPAASRPPESKPSAVQPVVRAPEPSRVKTKSENASSPHSKIDSSTRSSSTQPIASPAKIPSDAETRKPSESKPSPIVQSGTRTVERPLPATQPPSQKSALSPSSSKSPATASTTTNRSVAKPPTK